MAPGATDYMAAVTITCHVEDSISLSWITYEDRFPLS
jgi:hypothetical protein